MARRPTEGSHAHHRLPERACQPDRRRVSKQQNRQPDNRGTAQHDTEVDGQPCAVPRVKREMQNIDTAVPGRWSSSSRSSPTIRPNTIAVTMTCRLTFVSVKLEAPRLN